MVYEIIKRDGSKQLFDENKIRNALTQAFNDTKEPISNFNNLILNIVKDINSLNINTVEGIQDIVEDHLMKEKYYKTAKHYITYRYTRQLARDNYSELMNAVKEKLEAKNVQNQNANLDEYSFGGRVNEISGLLLKKYALDYGMSEKSKNNHLNNEIYQHDLDHYILGDHNCLSIPLDKLLANGFKTRQTDVRPAGSICTAMQIVAVIMQLQSLQQFGGVSATHIDWTMVPYVRKSFAKHYKNGLKYIEKYSEIDYEIEFMLKNVIDYSIEDPEYEAYAPSAYKYAIDMTIKECHQAIEAMYHNLNTLQSRSGCQLPFSSINYGTCTLPEGRMVIKELLNVSIEGLGKFHRTSIFPCGIFQCMKGVNREPGDPNYDLFRLALKSTSLRLYPNYANCDWSNQLNWVNKDREEKQKIINNLTDGAKDLLYQRIKENKQTAKLLNLKIDNNQINIDYTQDSKEIFSTMGCRTANGGDINFDYTTYQKAIEEFILKGYIDNFTYQSSAQKDGRGNICPVTIILPTIAMEADRNVDKFIKLLDTKIDEAKDSLIERFNYICSQSPKAATFMYENKLMEGYIPEQGVRSALKHGTLAIGQIGIAETLQLLIGKDQMTEEGIQLAKRIEQLFKDKCNKFKEEYNLNFGVYYTPAENLCKTSMNKFREKYGIIPNVSDKKYFTNSIHIPVFDKVNVFNKIDIESQLTGYSSAGCITYVELDSSSVNNIDAIEKIVNYAMDKDIPYFAINIPSDMCENCGYSGEINDKCPECGSDRISHLRRVTGYLTGDYKTAFNEGKQQEVEMRVKHTGVEI